MLADCTRRVRKYVSWGLVTGGLSAWSVVKMLEGRAPINRMQKGIWTLSGCLVGAGMATSVAGMHSMKQLVEMPDSPIADVARQMCEQPPHTVAVIICLKSETCWNSCLFFCQLHLE